MRSVVVTISWLVLLPMPGSEAHGQETWALGPFARIDTANPCLDPLISSRFLCPIRRTEVGWEAKDVFNPAAVVRGDSVYLFYRAQDSIGKPAGTSRIGLARSADGLRFCRNPVPVLYPDNDFMKRYEWEGGCEDPRIVQDDDGRYIMTYSAFDSRFARLAIATSTDLYHWKKEGLAFWAAGDGKYRDRPSKSGAIISRWINGTPVAVRIRGHYWMYWGDSDIHLATSEDLIHWTPGEDSGGKLVVALSTRKGVFDSRLVESGPPAILTDSGIVFIYNSSNARADGDPRLPAGAYSAGQALFEKDDPGRCIDRSASCFLRPETQYEVAGQVHNVCFAEGLVFFRQRWLLYYGSADSRISVISSPAKYLAPH